MRSLIYIGVCLYCFRFPGKLLAFRATITKLLSFLVLI